MKILQVSTSDIKGGAARAAYRLHKALLSENIETQMLVQNKSNDDYTVLGPTTKFKRLIGLLRPTLDTISLRKYKNRTKTLFSLGGLGFSGVVDKINDINPDIVHLHWVNGGMIRIEDIKKIKAPIIWSLHDNWVFTGGCHIMWDCEKYKNSCGACPRLGSSKEKDLSRKVFLRKKKVFSSKKDIVIVGLSKWITKCSKNSSLLKDKKHITLPNPIDINIFKPFDKERSRELWNLPKKKKLLLFGAMNATSDINKGFLELSGAIKKLRREMELELVIFGSSKPEKEPELGFKVHYVGNLHDNVSLVTLYSAIDVMVVPSLQESFGQTASEAMACKTPVVAFRHTGLLDIIDHKINGYLAKPFDVADLSRGIEWVLSTNKYQELCQNARVKVIKEFDSIIVSKKYINLYQSILDS
ncbi:MAG: Unknown protein [uncultured Campylobacterales bacterium]|uniref:Glycosyl transferase family 1 domain-containing protein n=1 Tax=uncultured Campylobacterales bacterium TaxID=352960 RepID=A0A6S6T624_9BACT|nr:MAG: Unknown protein [uncultured Campylobacterales bacterium]